jgi:hypothetical protein
VKLNEVEIVWSNTGTTGEADRLRHPFLPEGKTFVTQRTRYG